MFNVTENTHFHSCRHCFHWPWRRVPFYTTPHWSSIFASSCMKSELHNGSFTYLYMFVCIREFVCVCQPVHMSVNAHVQPGLGSPPASVSGCLLKAESSVLLCIHWSYGSVIAGSLVWHTWRPAEPKEQSFCQPALLCASYIIPPASCLSASVQR